MARDEGGGIGVLPFAEGVRLPGVRELVRISARLAVKGSGVRVVPGDVRVEGGGRGLVGGGGRALGCAGRVVGRVVAPVGGEEGRAEAGAWREVAPDGGTGGRVGAGAWEGGAADTLCDRARIDALMGEGLQSKAAVVGRVATID